MVMSRRYVNTSTGSKRYTMTFRNRVILMLVFGVVMYHVHQLNLTKPYSKSTISLKLYFKYLQIVQHYSEM